MDSKLVDNGVMSNAGFFSTEYHSLVTTTGKKSERISEIYELRARAVR